MKQVNISCVCNDTWIMLGRTGEKNARQVVFDISEWISLYGEGIAQLIHQRQGDSAPYPCAVAQNGAEVSWTITTADTATAGRGKAELQYFVGDALVKSVTWTTYTDAALSDVGDTPPEPQQRWVDQVLDAANRAEDAAERAEAASGGGGSGGGGGFSYKIGNGLKITNDDTLEVDSASDFEGNNTRPASASLVQSTVGNIELLLSTI